jgi:phosphoglycerate dehydrogenase-like enzyme
MQVVYWTNAGLAKAQIIERLRAMKGVELTIAENLPDLLAALPKAEALICYDAPEPQARQVVAALTAPGCKVGWMHILTVGREGFEAAGLPAGIAVSYAAGAVAPIVAEHAMALLLGLGRRIPEAMTAKESGKWDRSMAPRTTSVEGGTLAIVGYGQIGQEIAVRARGFSMKVVAVSRSAHRDSNLDASHPLTDLHAVLGTADVVAVTIALTPETRHLMDAAAFAACKRGALVINVARGGVIDQTALCAALSSGQLGGAGLDVTDPEPLPEGDPLWRCPNLILTPHYAGAGSPKSIERIIEGAIGNLQRFMAGETLRNLLSH